MSKAPDRLSAMSVRCHLMSRVVQAASPLPEQPPSTSLQHIMDQVNKEVLNTIQNLQTIRIIADVPLEILEPENYLSSAFTLLKPFTQAWGAENHSLREIVVDIYPRHAYIVIDINNHDYDFETAHLQHTPIPVYILRLLRKSKEWSFFRRPVEDRRVAKDVALLHWCNGQKRPPFFADHVKGSVYYSTRGGQAPI